MSASEELVTPSTDEFIRRVRRELSDIDGSIVEMVNRRLRLVSLMKRYKDEHGFDFVDLSREAWMLQYLQRANRGPLSADGLENLYHHLLALMKREVLAELAKAEA